MIAIPEPPETPDDGQAVVVSTRIKPKGVAAIDWLAEQDGVDRSEEVRRLLSEAVLARKRLIAARHLDAQVRAPLPKKR